MKKKYVVIVGILIGLFLLSVVDKCGQSNKYKKLRAEYKELNAIHKISHEKSKEAISEKTEEIRRADKKIKELELAVAKKGKILTEKGSEIEELEEAYDEAITKDEQIVNLQRQVQLWKEKFHIAENIIADKDAIIFSLTQKYEAEFVISNEWKSMYENELEMRNNLEAQIKALRKQVRGIKFGSTTKTGLLVIVGGILAYQMIKD